MRWTSTIVGFVVTLVCGCTQPAPGFVGPKAAALEEDELPVWPDPDNPPPLVCIGVNVPEAAYEAEPGPLLPEDPPESEPVVPEVGAAWPTFQLNDYQPQSCGTGATYGLDPFAGKVTVAILLAGW